MSKSIEKEQSKKKKLSFPSCYTIMLIVLVLVMGLTFIVPAGKYSTLSYDASSELFTITAPSGDTTTHEATQDTLNDLGVKSALKNSLMVLFGSQLVFLVHMKILRQKRKLL